LKTIDATLRKLRESRKLILREVGAEISLDPTILSKIEHDERMPTREQVKALSDFYKDQKNEIIIALLSDKLYYEVRNEELALQVIQVTENKFKYHKKNDKYKINHI
jgi:transcriptional regulator with XRE-family HTH domain